MFFKSHFISIADIIDAKFRGYQQIAKNPADKGELCEIFIKEFLLDSLGDSFKVFRGGRVINSNGDESKQLDIILTGKRTIKLFGDKGIYPTESVFGCISVTSTLTRPKLISCCEEFKSIPKKNNFFLSHGYIPPKYIEDSINIWKTLAPYKCVFAYQGEIKEEWIKDILEVGKDATFPYNAMPDLVVVNKVGFIEKKFIPPDKAEFSFIPFSQYENYGLPFGKILFELNKFNWEEFLLQPKIEYYLNKDM
jgi:hypothetical protein